MKEEYDYHKRIQHEGWLVYHIETLIKVADEHKNSSFVLYAAFEARNLIEKMCYTLILLSTNESEWEEVKKTAKGKQGIRRSNEKYKSLKYRFQTFSEAIGKAANLPVKAFNYNKAEELENELGEYVHSYTRTQTDMDFDSNFIQEGLKKVKSSVDFIKSYYIIENDEYVYGTLNFSSLPGQFKIEFENWIKSSSFDTEALYNRLIELNRKDKLILVKK